MSGVFETFKRTLNLLKQMDRVQVSAIFLLLLFEACCVTTIKSSCLEVQKKIFENEAVMLHVLRDYEMLAAPADGSEVVEVWMSAGLISVDGLEEYTERFSFTAWVTFTWRDPRLSWTLAAACDPRNTSGCSSSNSSCDSNSSSNTNSKDTSNSSNSSSSSLQRNFSEQARPKSESHNGCSCQATDDVTHSFFCNVTKLILPRKNVWTPNILVSNAITGFESLSESQFEGQVVVDLNGSVTWIIGDRFDVQCSVNTYKFPFDQQVCFAEFVTDTVLHKQSSLNLNSTTVDVSGFRRNAQFTLLRTELANGNFFADQPGVRLTVMLARRWSQHAMDGLFPILLISFLNTVVFLLPQECGERVSFSVTLLLSYIIFMSSISSTLPPNSLNVCLYSLYLAALMLLSTLCASFNVAIMAGYYGYSRALLVGRDDVMQEEEEGQGERIPAGCLKASTDVALATIAASDLTGASVESVSLSLSPDSGQSLSFKPEDTCGKARLLCPCRSTYPLEPIYDQPEESASASRGSRNRPRKPGTKALCGQAVSTWNKLAFYLTFSATLATHLLFAMLFAL